MASGFVTKEWKQRISEFATRRLLSIVSQSSDNMTVDVSRAEGLVSQVGDAFSPENMNGLEQRIANAFANVDLDVAAAKKSASDGKTLIAAAITEKKVAASASDTFAVLANKIKQIVLGSGNAKKADVLSGKTFTNDDGVEYTGTMPNRGSYGYSAVNSAGSGAAGYYSGITVDTRPSYTSGYNAGVTAADARVNTESANYKGGYNAGHAAGVTAADARVNKGSASYKQGVNDADARSNPGSVNYQTGYNAGYSAGGSGKLSMDFSWYHQNNTGGATNSYDVFDTSLFKTMKINFSQMQLNGVNSKFQVRDENDAVLYEVSAPGSKDAINLNVSAYSKIKIWLINQYNNVCYVVGTVNFSA